MNVPAAIVLALVLASPVNAEQPIRITVSPRIGAAPLSIQVRLTVEPNRANKGACVIYDGPVYRSSCWELTGSDDPKTFWLQFRDLPEGSYTVTGAVLRAGGVREQDSQEICVLGPSSDAETCFGGVR